MNLEITCKGIGDVSVRSSELSVTLQEVSPDFIEQLEIRDILMYADNAKLLSEMDYDEVVDYLEMKYDVKVLDQSGGVR